MVAFSKKQNKTTEEHLVINFTTSSPHKVKSHILYRDDGGNDTDTSDFPHIH